MPCKRKRHFKKGAKRKFRKMKKAMEEEYPYGEERMKEIEYGRATKLGWLEKKRKRHRR